MTRSRPSGVAAVLLWGAAALLLNVGGCSTYAKHVRQIRDAYYVNDLAAAEQLVETRLKRERGDADVLRLEKAMIELSSGRPAEAEQLLRTVRDHFDELEQKHAAEATLSYWTDDQKRAYAGEDYEKVLVRAMLALSNLFQDGADAEAYSLQMIDKQEQLIAAGAENGENPKLNYQRVALAPYLRGVMREATHRDYDDAERSFATVVSWQPEFTPGAGDLSRAAYGHHSQPGHGILYVFTLTGRGPYKEEAVETPTSNTLLIAGEIVGRLGNQTVPPNVAPVKVPQIIARENAVQSVAVGVDDQAVGFTQTITDVTSLAISQYQAVFPRIVARAVARRVLKKGVVYGAKEMADISKGSLPGVLMDVAGVAWEASESADTRCWGLLPDKIQVLRVELPIGEHVVQLAAVNGAGKAAHVPTQATVVIEDGRNTYVLGVFPDYDPVGELLVSHY